MKRVLMLFVISCCYINSKGQNAKYPPLKIYAPPGTVATDIAVCPEILPVYPGGWKAFYKYLAQTIVYPKSLAEKAQEQVLINFVVEKDGRLTYLKAIKSPSSKLSDECIKALKNCKFIPGTQGGKPCRVLFTLPVLFDSAHPTQHQSRKAS